MNGMRDGDKFTAIKAVFFNQRFVYVLPELKIQKSFNRCIALGKLF